MYSYNDNEENKGIGANDGNTDIASENKSLSERLDSFGSLYGQKKADTVVNAATGEESSSQTGNPVSNDGAGYGGDGVSASGQGNTYNAGGAYPYGNNNGGYNTQGFAANANGGYNSGNNGGYSQGNAYGISGQYPYGQHGGNAYPYGNANQSVSTQNFYGNQNTQNAYGSSQNVYGTQGNYYGNTQGNYNNQGNNSQGGYNNAQHNVNGQAYNNAPQGANPYGYNNYYANAGRSQAYDEYVRGRRETEAARREGSKKKEKPRFVTGIMVSLILVAAFILGWACASLAGEGSSLYALVKQKIQNNYLFEYDENLVEYYAALGMTEALDAYTTVLDPWTFYELIYAEEQELFGVSYAQNPSTGEWYVADVALDSPVDLAVATDGKTVGLRDGDIIKAVNEYTVGNNTTAEKMVSLFSSATELDIVINRNGKNYSFRDIQKTLYTARYVEYMYQKADGTIVSNMRYHFNMGGIIYSNVVEGGREYTGEFTNPEWFHHYDYYELDKVDLEKTGYLKLHEFSFTNEEMNTMTTTDFDEAMYRFKDVYNGKGKLILDLNGNPGGYNDYCVSVCKYFIYNGTPGENLEVYRMLDKNGNNIASETSVRSVYHEYFDVNAKTPQIFVMTNGNSASASEMLTGAVLVYETAIQVGTQTYGKGISQRVEPIKYVTIEYKGEIVTSAYAFYYTFAYFYTPDLGKTDNPYNNYCNQSDRNGDGEIGEGESNMGFKPLDEHTAKTPSGQFYIIRNLTN